VRGEISQEQNPAIRIVAADPKVRSIRWRGRPYLTEGVGEDFWPANYDRASLMRYRVSDADAFAWPTRHHEEGMLIGGSGGTAVVAALRVAETAPGMCVVVLVPIRVRLHSKIFNDDWMRGYGF